MSYQHDVFVSYPRAGALRRWVREVFAPQLDEALATAGLGRVPSVFVDVNDIDPGTDWPKELADAHHSSRVVVAVLCGPYFESGWCTSEWKNILAREEALFTATGNRPRLLFAIRFNDTTDGDVASLGDPIVREQVKARSRSEFGPYAHLVNRLSDTERAHDFRTLVGDLCDGPLKDAIRRAPAWDKDWPRLPEKPISGRDPSWSPR